MMSRNKGNNDDDGRERLHPGLSERQKYGTRTAISPVFPRRLRVVARSLLFTIVCYHLLQAGAQV